MPTIHISTEINSTIEICFDLSRSIDLHAHSLEHTNEKAIAGRKNGLIEDGEFVTWQAKHFGITQYLTSKISNYNRPFIFRDSQTKGIFDYFHHDHIFEEKDGRVIMTDVFEYKSPLGFLGRIADKLFLEKYMTNLLAQRNKVIKEYAESDKWKEVLKKVELSMDEDIKFKIIDLLKSNNFSVLINDNYLLTTGTQIIIKQLEADKYEILYEKPLHETNKVYAVKDDVLNKLESVIMLLNLK